MCGIVGYIGPQSVVPVIIEGLRRLEYRGYDSHGRPTEENAHPHRDGTGTLVVVHNGIVENYLSLKAALIAKGHKFVSETDTEIIAHLIEDELNLAAATKSGAPSFSSASSTKRVGSSSE